MGIKSRSIIANINLMPNKKYGLIYLQCRNIEFDVTKYQIINYRNDEVKKFC